MHVLTQTFFMEKVDDTQCRLKRDHAYYAQVQGQMGVTGAKWCDFIVYTSKGMYVERIAFDPNHWQTLRNQLLQYHHLNILLSLLLWIFRMQRQIHVVR